MSYYPLQEICSEKCQDQCRACAHSNHRKVQYNYPPFVRRGIYDVIKWRHVIGLWPKPQEVFLFTILCCGASIKLITSLQRELWVNRSFLGQCIREIYRKMSSRDVTWRHYLKFSPILQGMFFLVISSCGANIKSFASFKRKFGEVLYFQV